MNSIAALATAEPPRGDRSQVITFPPISRQIAGREATHSSIELHPADVTRHRSMAWPNLKIQLIQATRCEPLRYEFDGACHLLIAYERGERSGGETLVQGLAPCSRRDLSGKLSFVPAGLRFLEQYTPRLLLRATIFYIDAESQSIGSDAVDVALRATPRIFFEDGALWQTAQKLKSIVDNGVTNVPYAQALGSTLIQELLYACRGGPRREPPMCGGLAGWQRRVATQYIEDHLAEAIPLKSLAELVGLSCFHFARAFKQSFGMPPHRFHLSRRVEHAKILLAIPSHSVTEIAFDLGYGSLSAFINIFSKLTGQTPTQYRRSFE